MYDTSLGSANHVNSSAEEEDHGIFLQQMSYPTSRSGGMAATRNERNDGVRGRSFCGVQLIDLSAAKGRNDIYNRTKELEALLTEKEIV